jgi:hypothetical protein
MLDQDPGIGIPTLPHGRVERMLNIPHLPIRSNAEVEKPRRSGATSLRLESLVWD